MVKLKMSLVIRRVIECYEFMAGRITVPPDYLLSLNLFVLPLCIFLRGVREGVCKDFDEPMGIKKNIRKRNCSRGLLWDTSFFP